MDRPVVNGTGDLATRCGAVITGRGDDFLDYIRVCCHLAKVGALIVTQLQVVTRSEVGACPLSRWP
jgi:hypothetical protein